MPIMMYSARPEVFILYLHPYLVCESSEGALDSLCMIWASLSESLLLIDALSTQILCNGSYSLCLVDLV